MHIFCPFHPFSSFFALIYTSYFKMQFWLYTLVLKYHVANCRLDFPGGSVVKNPPANQETQETWFRSLDQEDPPREGMATHSNILTWQVPWTEEPGGLQSMRLQRVGHNWAHPHARAHTHTQTHTHIVDLRCNILVVYEDSYTKPYLFIISEYFIFPLTVFILFCFCFLKLLKSSTMSHFTLLCVCAFLSIYCHWNALVPCLYLFNLCELVHVFVTGDKIVACFIFPVRKLLES